MKTDMLDTYVYVEIWYFCDIKLCGLVQNVSAKLHNIVCQKLNSDIPYLVPLTTPLGAHMEVVNWHLTCCLRIASSVRSIWVVPPNFCLDQYPKKIIFLIGAGGVLFRPIIIRGACDGAFGWGTGLQAGQSLVQFVMLSLEFFIVIILLATLWPSGWQPLTEMSTTNISWGLKAADA
jgi:hypothetical protein